MGGGGRHLPPLHAAVANDLTDMYDFLMVEYGYQYLRGQGAGAAARRVRLHAAAARGQAGQARLFKHVLRSRCITMWKWGPVSGCACRSTRSIRPTPRATAP